MFSLVFNRIIYYTFDCFLIVRYTLIQLQLKYLQFQCAQYSNRHISNYFQQNLSVHGCMRLYVRAGIRWGLLYSLPSHFPSVSRNTLILFMLKSVHKTYWTNKIFILIITKNSDANFKLKFNMRIKWYWISKYVVSINVLVGKRLF